MGNHGVHIPVNNEGLNAYGAGFSPFPATVPTPIFATVQQYSSSGISNYNGVTASVAMRQTHGLSLQFSYTWSHAMDDVSNGGISATPYNNSQTFGSLVYQINPGCLTCNNYGNADYDVRNSFNGTYVYQTPFKFSNSFANAALGGWMVSENFFWRSGLPLTVIDGNTSITNYGPTQHGCERHCWNGQHGLRQWQQPVPEPRGLRFGELVQQLSRTSAGTSTVDLTSSTPTSPSARTSS